MRRCSALLCGVLSFCVFAARATAGQTPESAQQAYEKGDYERAINILQEAAAKEPNNGDIQLLLTKSYLEIKKYDDAVKSGEKAVAIQPNSSLYHQWLGEAYGEKADHASMLSAYGLARKTQKEFETAVQLDEHNFDAAQDLVEYDCTAPGMVGGGVEKAQPLSQKLMSMDAAEGHFSVGVCKAVKKDLAAADDEYAKALENKPKTANRLFDVGDYFMQRGEGDKLLQVAAQGETLAPKDPRTKYYRAAGWILKGENLPEAEKLLKEYLQEAPVRSTYPSPVYGHYWLGRAGQLRNDMAAAKDEYRVALKLDPKFKKAEEALKELDGR
jgi:tetratricopeptide (TPR) repeat protein